MEARGEYLGRVERPRLTVVRDDGESARYSALPHAVLFDKRLSAASVRLYAVLQSHWWKDGECYASHATLAEQMGVQERQIRRLIRELVAGEHITERPRGKGQAKAYAPVDTASQADKNDRLNGSEMSACEYPKRTKMTGQQVKNVRFKRSKMSAPIEVTPVKKTIEEELPPTGVGVGAAVAADPPSEGGTKAKASKGTRCPETFPLEARHYAYAAEHGYADIAKVAAITDAFLNHHRFRGTVGKDWYAGWQNWIRKQREMDDERAARQPARRNGAPEIPPGSASKQQSKWSDFKGRHGYHSNVVSQERDDGRV